MQDLKPFDLQSLDFGDFYDELPLWSAPFGLLLLEHVPLREGQTILDVGAGTGFLSIELAQRCNQSRVMAVDPWRTAAHRLRKKIEFLGLTNVEIYEQDAATLDVADNSVDLIVSNLGINNFENATEVLQTCSRVARPGAVILMTSNLLGTMHEFYDTFREVLAGVPGDHRLVALEKQIRHRATTESLHSQVERAGFRVTRTITDSFNWRFSSGTAMLRHRFMQIAFVPAWREILAPDENDVLYDLMEQRLNERAKRLSGLSLTIPLALVEAAKPSIRVIDS